MLQATARSIWVNFPVKLLTLAPFRTKFGVFDPGRNFVEPGFGLGPALDFGPTFGRSLTGPVAARKLAAGAFLH